MIPVLRAPMADRAHQVMHGAPTATGRTFALERFGIGCWTSGLESSLGADVEQ